MRGHNQIRLMLLGLLLLAMPAWAQLKVGDDVSMNMTGTIGTGYTGDYGNTMASDHGLGLNGEGQVNGYFYNPKFLNFYVRPMYNRSQENSGSGSITDASSINMGAGIFGGSHFPGSISFGKSIGSTGNYGLPGIQGYTTSSDSTAFGIGWSELLPGLPPLSASYTQSSSSSSLFGSDQEDHSSQRIFTLQSQYRLHGWMNSARFSDLGTHTELPSFLTAGETIENDENSKTFTFNTNHKLPMQGGVTFGYTYGSFNGEGNGSRTSGSDQTFTGNASFVPLRRLTTSFGFQYDSSLNGLVEEQLISAGSVAPQVNFGSQSHSLTLYNFDSVAIGKGLNASFDFTRVQQEVYGHSVAVDQFSAVLNYNFHKPLWGAFNFYGGVNDQATEGGNQGTGLVAGVNFNKKMRGFDLSAGFGYAQNVQTVLATQVTSDYSYLANASRSLTRHLLWNANYHGFHTGLGQLPGSSSHSQGFGTNLTYKGYGGAFSYASSYGTALLTASGLVSAPVTIVPVLSGNQYLLENGSSYSASLSATPMRQWTMSAGYSKAATDTATPTVFANSSSKMFLYFTQWQFRKVSLGGGYTRLIQGGTTTEGALPVDYSSFYIGIQRWFRPF